MRLIGLVSVLNFEYLPQVPRHRMLLFAHVGVSVNVTDAVQKVAFLAAKSWLSRLPWSDGTPLGVL